MRLGRWAKRAVKIAAGVAAAIIGFIVYDDLSEIRQTAVLLFLVIGYMWWAFCGVMDDQRKATWQAINNLQHQITATESAIGRLEDEISTLTRSLRPDPSRREPFG